jgi:uncharacterized protein Yka (UPF0111/DUF47 family)
MRSKSADSQDRYRESKDDKKKDDKSEKCREHSLSCQLNKGMISEQSDNLSHTVEGLCEECDRLNPRVEALGPTSRKMRAFISKITDMGDRADKIETTIRKHLRTSIK